MFHYNKLKDDILNWDGVNLSSGSRDIDRFEENNKLVSINVFEPDDCLNDNKIILHRGTRNGNAKYEIDLPARTAQGGGGSFRARKPIGEVDCCDAWMAEQTH